MPKTNDLFRKHIKQHAPGAKIYLTEHYNSFSKKKKDLFGFVDFIVFDAHEMNAGEGFMSYYQITSPGNIYSRLRKIAADDTMLDIVCFLVKHQQLVLVWGKDATKEIVAFLDSEGIGKQKFSIKPREMVSYANVMWKLDGTGTEVRAVMKAAIESLIKKRYTSREISDG